MSGRQQGDSHRADKTKDSPKRGEGDRKAKHQAGDLGRALRSVYDDTLRESVPDDFQNLLDKLG